VFREVFEEIVRRRFEAGLVEGQNVAVDGTMVGAMPADKVESRESS
jgi:transposase